MATRASDAVAAPPKVDHKLGFSSLEAERTVDALELEGALPKWLSGSLLRTGPARFEVGGRSLNHWFDGQAMLHRFSFDGGSVSYANRYLRSRAYGETQKGRLGYSEFATDPCRSLFKRVQTLFSPVSGISDNGNVNVSRLGDEFIAMTETPMPLAFDPVALETVGSAYKPPGQITTAHPHHDVHNGELVNYAARLGPRSSYRFFAQRGRRQQRLIASLGVSRPAYVHSFGMTERHLVLAEFPFAVNPLRLALAGRPYIENYRWRPERAAKLHVFDHQAGRLHRSYEAQAGFCFHHVNAFERNGELICDLLRYDDPAIIGALYLEQLRDGREPIPLPQLCRYRMNLSSGGLTEERLAEPKFELPRIDYSRNGRPYRYVYGFAINDDGVWPDAIVKLDIESGESETWSEGSSYPGEPVFVPAPQRDSEDEGVLLSVVLDAERETSSLLVLDARTLEQVARARVPHHIPHSFHGQYTARV
jgi:beta,beta-carotene 9',10'-dioxygenase